MKRSFTRCMTVSALVGVLSGCVTTYVPLAGDRMVKVHNVGFGAPQICIAGKVYWPPASGSGTNDFEVPSGKRLTIGAHLASAGYQVNYTCRPFLSFVPTAGQTYLLNSALYGEGRCAVELVREDPHTSTGVALEKSVGPAACSK